MPLIEGYCHKDFTPVRELFKSNFDNDDEENAQLCVYVGDELVIDLWGSKDESNPDRYGPDSLQVISYFWSWETRDYWLVC